MSLFASMGDDSNVWSKGSSLFNISSPLNDLLESDSFTLDQILQEDELIQEVKTRNPKLLEFMSQEDVVFQLIHYVVQAPEDTMNDMRTLKYPYMACEVICCDISSITETLACAQDGKIVEALFAFLNTTGPLDPRLAGYFEKIMSMLMVRKPQEMTALMNKHADALLQAFVNHAQSYSVSELLKRLLQPYHNDYMEDMMDFPGMSMHGSGSGGTPSNSWYGSGLDDDEMSVGTPTSASTKKTLVWQQDTNVIDLLVANLQAKVENGDVHKHSADILVDIIHCATRAQTNGVEVSSPSNHQGSSSLVLLEYLETPAILQQLLDLAIPMTGVPCVSSSMTGALSVLSALLSRHTNLRYSSVDTLPTTVASIVARLPQLCATLRAEDEDVGMIINQRHQSVPRLGLRRLKLVGLIVLLLQTKYTRVDAVVLEERAIDVCLDLFFKFESVNMLHADVESMVVGILENGGPDLLTALLQQGRLLPRILEAHEQNEVAVNTPRGFSLGFVGHLHHICHTIIRLTEDVQGDELMTANKEQSLHEMSHADTVVEMLEEDQAVWQQWQALASRVLKPLYERECQPLGGDGHHTGSTTEDPYTIFGNTNAMAAMNDKFAEMLSSSQFDGHESLAFDTDFDDGKQGDSIMMPELIQDSSSSDEEEEEGQRASSREGDEEVDAFGFNPRESTVVVQRWQNVEASDEDDAVVGSNWANFEQATNAFASFEASAEGLDSPPAVMEDEGFAADFSQMEEPVVAASTLPPAPITVDTTEEEAS